MRYSITAAALVAVASAGQYMSPPPSQSEVWVTSTLLSTTTSTVISCHPSVSNCPGHPELQTETKTVTSVITVGTTVCPLTQVSSSSTPSISKSATIASSTPCTETTTTPTSTPCTTETPSSPAGGQKTSPASSSSTPCTTETHSSPAGGQKASSSSPAGGMSGQSTCSPVTETCTVTVTAPAGGSSGKPTYPASSSPAGGYKASSSGAVMKPSSTGASPVQFTGAAVANNAAGFLAGAGALAALLL